MCRNKTIYFCYVFISNFVSSTFFGYISTWNRRTHMIWTTYAYWRPWRWPPICLFHFIFLGKYKDELRGVSKLEGRYGDSSDFYRRQTNLTTDKSVFVHSRLNVSFVKDCRGWPLFFWNLFFQLFVNEIDSVCSCMSSAPLVNSHQVNWFVHFRAMKMDDFPRRRC